MLDLTIKNVSFNYGDKVILKNISFKAKRKKLTALIGVNGAGKTTLLKCINGINKISSGDIIVDSKSINDYSINELAKKISYVSQSLTTSFSISVFDMILIGRVPFLGYRVKKEDREIVYDVIKSLKIEHLAFKDINKLSGGEKQKVLIARSLVQKTNIVLLDEPTSNLDYRAQLDLLSYIKGMIVSNEMIGIIVLHDLNLASMFCDDILLINNNTLYKFGSPSDVINNKSIRETYGVDIKLIENNGIQNVVLTGL